MVIYFCNLMVWLHNTQDCPAAPLSHVPVQFQISCTPVPVEHDPSMSSVSSERGSSQSFAQSRYVHVRQLVPFTTFTSLFISCIQKHAIVYYAYVILEEISWDMKQNFVWWWNDSITMFSAVLQEFNCWGWCEIPRSKIVLVTFFHEEHWEAERL